MWSNISLLLCEAIFNDIAIKTLKNRDLFKKIENEMSAFLVRRLMAFCSPQIISISPLTFSQTSSHEDFFIKKKNLCTLKPLNL